MTVDPSGIGVYSPKIRDEVRLSCCALFLKVVLPVGIAFADATVAPRILVWGMSPDGVFWSVFVSILTVSFIAVGMVSMTHGIHGVFGRRTISQIFGPVIKTIAIQMANLLSFGPRPINKERDQLVDIYSLGTPIDVNDSAIVTSTSTAACYGQDLPIATLSLDTRDDLVGTQIELISWCPRNRLESFMIAVDRPVYVHETLGSHRQILASVGVQ